MTLPCPLQPISRSSWPIQDHVLTSDLPTTRGLGGPASALPWLSPVQEPSPPPQYLPEGVPPSVQDHSSQKSLFSCALGSRLCSELSPTSSRVGVLCWPGSHHCWLLGQLHLTVQLPWPCKASRPAWLASLGLHSLQDTSCTTGCGTRGLSAVPHRAV